MSESPPAATTVSQSEEKWVLLTTIMASSMAFIGGSALNVAQDALQTGLDASLADLLWIINGYALMLAALILIGGSLGDHFGRKRVFLTGVGIATAASIACGVAPNVEVLIFFRFIQGVGAALMVPGSLAILSATVAPERRGVNIGMWSMFGALFQVIGPILGGIFAGAGLWRGVFFINVPIAAVVFWAARRVPETRDEEAANHRLDYVGAFLGTVALALITYGFIQGDALGWDHPLILTAMIGGAALMVVFLWWEGRVAYPMMPLTLFKSRTFAGSNALTFMLYGALAGSLTFLPLNLIQVQGYDDAVAGLTFIPMTLLLAGISRYSGAWMDRVGARLPLTIGPIITGFGFLLFAVPGVTDGASDYWTTFFPAIVVFGIGMGITVAPLTTAVMSSAPAEQSGIASGINNAISRSSGVLAVAMMGAIALISFRGDFISNIEDLNLPPEAVAALEDDAANLGATTAPDGLTVAQTAAVELQVKESFVGSFRILAIVAAAFAWLSAFLGWLLIEGKHLDTPDDVVIVHADRDCPQHITQEMSAVAATGD